MTGRRAGALLAAGGLLAGCVRHEITVMPASVYAAHEAIAGGSGAILVTDAGAPHLVLPGDKVEIVDLAGRHQKIVVSALLSIGVASEASYVVVGHDHRLAHGAKVALVTTGIVGGLGGLIYCAAECSTPGSYVADGVLVALGTLFVGATVAGIRALGAMH